MLHSRMAFNGLDRTVFSAHAHRVLHFTGRHKGPPSARMSPEGGANRRYDPAVEWVRDFYSVTGRWWGRAESPIGPVDRGRVATLHAICGETPKRILELGCGYGSTVAAMTEAGHHVTGVEISDRADFSEQFAEQLGSRLEDRQG